jgi:hypothetical protein
VIFVVEEHTQLYYWIWLERFMFYCTQKNMTGFSTRDHVLGIERGKLHFNIPTLKEV